MRDGSGARSCTVIEYYVALMAFDLRQGMSLFKYPITSTIGGIEIDLASAPLEPGEHRLEIESTIGGIEIYVRATCNSPSRRRRDRRL